MSYVRYFPWDSPLPFSDIFVIDIVSGLYTLTPPRYIIIFIFSHIINVGHMCVQYLYTCTAYYMYMNNHFRVITVAS